jgi:hypothetical protein
MSREATLAHKSEYDHACGVRRVACAAMPVTQIERLRRMALRGSLRAANYTVGNVTENRAPPS